jgi:hypothetical protein
MKANKPLLLIGIDPGRNTGFAVFNPANRALILRTVKLHKGFEHVHSLLNFFLVEVEIEDPNLWTRFAKNDTKVMARIKGVGSVMRDFSAWVDFFEEYNIPFRKRRPDKTRNSYAYDEKLFRKITGYTARCSEHARVAAMLVYK